MSIEGGSLWRIDWGLPRQFREEEGRSAAFVLADLGQAIAPRRDSCSRPVGTVSFADQIRTMPCGVLERSCIGSAHTRSQHHP